MQNDTEQQVRKEKKKKSRKQVIREREVEAIAQSDALKEDKLFNKNKGEQPFTPFCIPASNHAPEVHRWCYSCSHSVSL